MRISDSDARSFAKGLSKKTNAINKTLLDTMEVNLRALYKMVAPDNGEVIQVQDRIDAMDLMAPGSSTTLFTRAMLIKNAIAAFDENRAALIHPDNEFVIFIEPNGTGGIIFIDVPFNPNRVLRHGLPRAQAVAFAKEVEITYNTSIGNVPQTTVIPTNPQPGEQPVTE